MIEKSRWFVFFLMSFAVSAQIKGVVVDEKDMPIPYVNIWVEDENIWTTSEEYGAFNINVAQDKNLIFSALGFEKRIVKASAIERVILKQSFLKLEEVLVEKRKETLEREIGKTTNQKTTLISGKRSWISAKYFPYDLTYSKTKFIKSAILITKSKVNDAVFKVRVFSKAEHGKPDFDLIEEDIIVTVKKGRKKSIIDLSKYNLVFPKEGIFIAFESLMIEKNKYDFKYTIEGNPKTHTEEYYAPDLVCTLSDQENTYHMANGKWIKLNKWHSNETERSLLRFNNKVIEPAINMILSN